MKNKILLSLLIVCFIGKAFGQGSTGTLSGSIESRSHYYFDDLLLNVIAPEDRFASNNYIWLQYNNGPLSAGIQYEAYMPPLAGFPYQYEGNALSHKFLRFKKGIIDVTAGNFYGQFGSGLSFRSYEDRSLGLNNSLDGIKVILKPFKGITIKGLYGKQRRFLDNTNSYLRGLDGEIDLGTLLKSDNSIRLGGGIVSRYNPYFGPDLNYPATVNAVNTRLGIDISKISFYSEYVRKSPDPDAINMDSDQIGHALSTNATFATRGFGIFMAARLLKEMNFQAERFITDGYSNINYLPSNTRQYTYLLSNLYPYTSQAEGEISFQADITYSLPLISKSGTDIRLNYAIAKGLQYSDTDNNLLPLPPSNKYYGDFNLEVTNKWSRKFKTYIAFQNIYFNRGQVEGITDEIIKASIVILDGTMRINRKISVRTELQHLWSEDDHGNWIAALAEVNFSPGWSFFLSDMNDYTYTEKAHYFNYGLSYRTSYFRISLGYGRNREGYICSGGVCRKIPAYKGLNLGITTSF